MTTPTKLYRIRGRQERGRTRLDWLDSYHTFSFGDYYDPQHMHFGDLRVINDDLIAPGGGFGMHPHRDMEIITVVLNGELEHKDSMGNGSIILPGDVQRMSAGSGVLHSEFNPSAQNSTRLLQIWIMPGEKGIEPGYEQKSFPLQERRGRLQLLISPDGREGSMTIHQDAELFATLLDTGQTVAYALPTGRKTWLQVAAGTVELDDQVLEEGDAVGLNPGVLDSFELTGLEANAQVLIFNLR